jgi:predicted fused transcriptional regulator/phosphomethylpyrimidine kinase
MPVYGYTLNEFIKLIPKEEINNVKSLVNERQALRREIKNIEGRINRINKELKLIFKKKNPKDYEAYEKNARDPLVLMGR